MNTFHFELSDELRDFYHKNNMVFESMVNITRSGFFDEVQDAVLERTQKRIYEGVQFENNIWKLLDDFKSQILKERNDESR